MANPIGTRWAWLLLAMTGCAVQPSGPPAAEAPVVTVRLTQSAGALLATTVPSVKQVDADTLTGLDVTWAVMQSLPPNVLAPLDAQSSLTSAPLAVGAVLTSGKQTRAARFGSGSVASEFIERLSQRSYGPVDEVEHQQAWLAPETTVRFSASAGRTERSVTIAVSASEQPATTAPADNGRLVSLAITLRSDANAGAETAYLTGVSLSNDSPHVLLVPWQAADGTPAALVAYLQPRASTPAERAAAASAWEALLNEQSGKKPVATTQSSDQLSLARAIDVLRTDARPGPALIYLAAATQATVAGDVILVADANLLNKLRDAILEADASSVTPQAIGWLLDRTALLTLADAASKAPLPPEMVAVLAIHTGEVGRHPDLLTEVTQAVANADDLHNRLIGENYIALEDNAASARVRAFDWLKSQNRAPDGYDPLGPLKERRSAITRAINPGGTP